MSYFIQKHCRTFLNCRCSRAQDDTAGQGTAGDGTVESNRGARTPAGRTPRYCTPVSTSRRLRSRTPATHSPNQPKLPSAQGDCEAHLSTAASFRARSQLQAPAPQQQLDTTFLTAAQQRYETAKWTLSPVKSSRAVSRLSTPSVTNAAAVP